MKKLALSTLTLLCFSVLPGCIVISSTKYDRNTQKPAQSAQCQLASQEKTWIMTQIDTAVKMPSGSAENVLKAIASRPDLSSAEQEYLVEKVQKLPSSSQEQVLLILASSPRPQPQPAGNQPKGAPQPIAPSDPNK